MLVIRAAHLGICFGVRDALHAAHSLTAPAQVTIRGQLVHNPLVNRDLARRGFHLQAEDHPDRTPDTRTVLVTAHGISNRRRHALLAAGKQIVDTTCPLVARAHRAGILLARLGYHVLVIGRRGHVEVNGLTEDLPSFDILESETDARTWPHAKLGIIQQTTTPLHHAAAVSAAVRRLNPHAQVRDVGTICRPTRDRQRALDDLLERVEMVVVVGGRESNNTRQLAARCEQRGVRAVQVESAPDLRAAWFAGVQRVGLTAGTSTLPQTVDAVHDRLLLIARSLPPQHGGLGEVA